MNRRRLLLGMGTTAAGAGAVFGSGAFTQVQAERSVTIGIDEDSAALLQLTPGSGVGSVDTDGSGQLVIDTEQLTNGGNQGFSVGSTVLLGETDGDGIPSDLSSTSVVGNDAKVAFKLTNNFQTVPGDDDGNDKIDIAINLEDIAVDSTNEPQSSLTFIGTVDPENSDPTTEVVSGGSQAIFNDVAHDSEIYFAILLETASTTEPEDIKGTVRFRAGPNLANEFPTDATVSDSGIVNVTQDTTHTSIQSAVDGANTGDLIQVGNGTFSTVTIDKEGLTLEAAEGASPIIGADGGDGFAVGIQASDVRVEGFTVQNFAENGITIFGSADGAEVVDNTVDTSQATIRAPGGSRAINTNDGGASNILIEGNNLGYASEAAIFITDNNNVEITGNTIDNSDDDKARPQEKSTGVSIAGGTNIDISNNTISEGGNGIQLLDVFDAIDDVSVISNVITDHDSGFVAKALDTISNVAVNQNNIKGNNEGLRALESIEVIDATDNWWGVASGPDGGVTDPETDATADGAGDKIILSEGQSENVRFDPFLESTNQDAGADN